MKIKKIIIKNFRSYYGENPFEISDGLTLFIGDNGDGKTTFYEALEWLFNTSVENSNASNISEMRKAELNIGEEDDVSVTLIFEHNGEKEICKKFMFWKQEGGAIATGGYSFNGYAIVGNERQNRSGKDLLESCFDTIIRKYCLFKGERTLNIFEDDTALKTLVETFSNIKQFDGYVDLTENFEQLSDDLVRKELRKDKKQEANIRRIECDLSNVQREITALRQEIAAKEKTVSDYETRMRVLEENQDACENLQVIKDRIDQKRRDKIRLNSYINLNYNTMLLDEQWILRNFSPILKLYKSKAWMLNLEKRRLQKEEDTRIAKEEARKETIEEIQKLANDATPLPWNLPDAQTMQEMINDHVCKVCGTPAPEGSPAYEFMVKKLNEYLENVNKTKATQQEERKPLFENSYIDELWEYSIQAGGDVERDISGLSTKINDRLSFVQDRKHDLDKVSQELEEAEDEKIRLLVQTPDLDEDMLDRNFRDYRGLSENSKRASNELHVLQSRLAEYEQKKSMLKEEQDKITPSNNIVQVYQRVHTVLDKIMKAFASAKNRNINDFLQTLEKEANSYFKKLNAGDFSGIIKIRQTADNSARMILYSSNETPITNPGGAQRTTMYMSVLFAVSKITTLKRSEDYPLIFDAPTSSFGEFKEDVFYNIIDSIDKQCIIFTKDLLKYNRETNQRDLDYNKIDQLSCSVYRIQKAPGYNPEDLSTIKTQINRIK